MLFMYFLSFFILIYYFNLSWQDTQETQWQAVTFLLRLWLIFFFFFMLKRYSSIKLWYKRNIRILFTNVCYYSKSISCRYVKISPVISVQNYFSCTWYISLDSNLTHIIAYYIIVIHEASNVPTAERYPLDHTFLNLLYLPTLLRKSPIL